MQDGGTYTCRASNALGQAETLATVKVIAKSNVITETEHEAAMQQISYLESHQVMIIKRNGFDLFTVPCKKKLDFLPV